MSTGMHHACLLRSTFQSCVFLNRQRVNVSAQQDRFSLSFFAM